MIYELRIYHAVPGRLPALNRRFEDVTLKFFDKHGIRPVGFWTVLVGDSNQDLYYILEWENLAERETKWSAFQTDADWIQARRASQMDGALYTHVTNLILSPTAYSRMK